jgi:hypothetical protein
MRLSRCLFVGALALRAQSPVQHDGPGLRGNIVMDFPPAPFDFGYGISFYSAVWPLLDRPLDRFQIGLPATWIIPRQAGSGGGDLCPAGTPARDQHWERDRHGSFADVFQTIEGSAGFWVSTRFPSLIPKYRMNGTPDCYTTEISSPLWGFGRTQPLGPEQIGIVQLSNRLLIPPDGLTFEPGVNGELLGWAWMALPIVDPRDEVLGDKSWTLFLNTANFKGPVAFWLPRTWSRIADNYPPDIARGLDVRPGMMRSGAMEFNTVPWIESASSNGSAYSKIPKLHFPPGELMESVTAWSDGALFRGVLSWLRSGSPVSGAFAPAAGWTSSNCKVQPLYFRQGPPADDHQLTGFDRFVRTRILDRDTCAWGLEWRTEERVFPEYFKQSGADRIAIPAAEVPRETGLIEAQFRPARSSGPYVSNSGPASTPLHVTLNDGSVVLYRRYRFADQPSLAAAGFTREQKIELQRRAELLQSTWTPDHDYIPPPAGGKLAALERVILVTPPRGLERGYVPIVVGQQSRE